MRKITVLAGAAAAASIAVAAPAEAATNTRHQVYYVRTARYGNEVTGLRDAALQFRVVAYDHAHHARCYCAMWRIPKWNAPRKAGERITVRQTSAGHWAAFDHNGRTVLYRFTFAG